MTTQLSRLLYALSVLFGSQISATIVSKKRKIKAAEVRFCEAQGTGTNENKKRSLRIPE
jgi:hypothetical protein